MCCLGMGFVSVSLSAAYFKLEASLHKSTSAVMTSDLEPRIPDPRQIWQFSHGTRLTLYHGNICLKQQRSSHAVIRHVYARNSYRILCATNPSAPNEISSHPLCALFPARNLLKALGFSAQIGSVVFLSLDLCLSVLCGGVDTETSD